MLPSNVAKMEVAGAKVLTVVGPGDNASILVSCLFVFMMS